jgi:hypothetical protein
MRASRDLREIRPREEQTARRPTPPYADLFADVDVPTASGAPTTRATFARGIAGRATCLSGVGLHFQLVLPKADAEGKFADIIEFGFGFADDWRLSTNQLQGRGALAGSEDDHGADRLELGRGAAHPLCVPSSMRSNSSP